METATNLWARWFCPTEGARVLSGGGGDAEWTGAALTHTEAGDAVSAPPAVPPLAVDGCQQPPGSLASPQNPSAAEVTLQHLHFQFALLVFIFAVF